MGEAVDLDAARTAIVNLLRLRATLSERQIRAALLGKRMRLSEEQLRRVLEFPEFVLGPDDRWTHRPAGTPPTPDRSATQLSSARVPAVELDIDQLGAALGASREELAAFMSQLADERADVDWAKMWSLLLAGGTVRITPPTLQALRAAVDAANGLRFIEVARDRAQAAERQAADDAQSRTAQARTEADRALSQLRTEGERARKAEVESRNAQFKQRELEKKLVDLELQMRRAENKVRTAEQSAQSAASSSRPAIGPSPNDALPHAPLGTWRAGSRGGSQHLHVAPPTTHGEVVLAAELQKLEHGLIVLNATIAAGSQEREVDAIVILPIGVFTVEQKDTRMTGTLEIPTNGPATVDDKPMSGGDHRGQARKQSQPLASLVAEDPRIDVGFVTPVLAYHGEVVVATQMSGTVVVRNTKALADQLAIYGRVREQHVNRPTVIDLLERLQVPPLVWEDIALAGFADE